MSTIALSAARRADAPRLRDDVTIVEQVFRGETSYVVKDPTTRKYFRFRAVEVGVMRCFDGRHTPQEIAARLAEQGLRLTAAAVESFARRLATIGLVERTLAERTTLELERIRAERRRRRQQTLFRGELLRMRWSFGDPDVLFDRALPAVRWMFTRAFVVCTALLVATYIGIVIARWPEFAAAVAAHFGPTTIDVGSVALLWAVILIVTFIHELGHGFACKHFGGEVHEMGFMLVYFQPAFYCNVNDAWSFPDLRSRLLVTAAGAWIELAIGSLAGVVWCLVHPGSAIADLAVMVMLVGGTTAVLANANPLLPLDGYFALSDWLEIPNFRHRASGYLGWWIRHRVLRAELPEPAVTDRERRVFLIYAPLSIAYIGAMFAVIATWLLRFAGGSFGALGTTAVLVAIALLARGPAMEWGRAVAGALRARGDDRARRSGWRRAAIGAAIVIVVLAVTPWTLTVAGPFVVAPANAQAVMAPDSGVVGAVYVREGMRVSAGTPLLRVINRELAQEELATLRVVDSLTLATIRARASGSAAVVQQLDAERVAATAQLTGIRERLDALTLRARTSGVVLTPRVQEIEGRAVAPGTTVMQVGIIDSLEARVQLSSAGAAMVRAGQRVHLVDVTATNAITTSVAGIAPTGSGVSRAGALEVRVRLDAGEAWRAGETGEASIELRRSTMLGALWWGVRQRLRQDLFL